MRTERGIGMQFVMLLALSSDTSRCYAEICSEMVNELLILYYYTTLTYQINRYIVCIDRI